MRIFRALLAIIALAATPLALLPAAASAMSAADSGDYYVACAANTVPSWSAVGHYAIAPLFGGWIAQASTNGQMSGLWACGPGSNFGSAKTTDYDAFIEVQRWTIFGWADCGHQFGFTLGQNYTGITVSLISPPQGVCAGGDYPAGFTNFQGYTSGLYSPAGVQYGGGWYGRVTFNFNV